MKRRIRDPRVRRSGAVFAAMILGLAITGGAWAADPAPPKPIPIPYPNGSGAAGSLLDLLVGLLGRLAG